MKVTIVHEGCRERFRLSEVPAGRLFRFLNGAWVNRIGFAADTAAGRFVVPLDALHVMERLDCVGAAIDVELLAAGTRLQLDL